MRLFYVGIFLDTKQQVFKGKGGYKGPLKRRLLYTRYNELLG